MSTFVSKSQLDREECFLTAGMNPTPIKRVHFIEYNAKENTLAVSPIFPKYGTPLLGAILKENGYDVRIFLEGVSDMSFGKITDCDAVCFPVFAPALNKVRECAKRIRAEHPGLPIIMGGPQVSLYPHTVADVCDYAVRCEGDEALPDILACISHGEDARGVLGVSFMQDGQIHHNADRVPPHVPDTAPDLTLIDGFDQAVRKYGGHRVVNTLQTSRGCHFHCKFCPTFKLFGGTYRTRSIDSIIEDIRCRIHYNPVFLVVDNSFFGDRNHAVELLQKLIKENLGAQLIIFERHQIGHDDEMLELIKRAGVRTIIVGIESLTDESLQSYDKRQTSAAVVENVRNILSHDIHVIGTFVLGGDEDTKSTKDGIIRFFEETHISLNLFIMHDVEIDESRGLLIPLNRRFQTYYERTAPGNTAPWDYMTGSFATYFPKRMKPSTLQQSVLDVYERVFSHRNIMRRVFARNRFEATFGIVHGYGVKRLTDSIRRIVDDGYMEYLREIEKDLYDDKENLLEDRLASLQGLPLPKPLEEQVNFDRYENLIPMLAIPGIIRDGISSCRSRNK